MGTGATSFARSETADLAKGFAIVLVVVGHCLPPDSPAWWRALHDLIYLFHIPTFFFVAGYIGRLRPQKCYREHLLHRAHQLLTPYVAVASVYLLGKLAASTLIELDHPVTLSTVSNALVDPVRSFAPFLWFLPVLFAVCAAFWSLQRFGGIVAGLSLPLAAGLYFLPSNFYLSRFLVGYVHFGIGAMLSERLDLDHQIPRHVHTLAFGAFTFLVAGGLFWPVQHARSDQIRFLLLSTTGIAAVVLACQSLRASCFRTRQGSSSNVPSQMIDLLAWLGRSCLTIYLFHTMFQGIARVVPSGLPFLVRTAVSVAAGTFLPIAFETLALDRSKVLACLFLGKPWPKGRMSIQAQAKDSSVIRCSMPGSGSPPIRQTKGRTHPEPTLDANHSPGV